MAASGEVSFAALVAAVRADPGSLSNLSSLAARVKASPELLRTLVDPEGAPGIPVYSLLYAAAIAGRDPAGPDFAPTEEEALGWWTRNIGERVTFIKCDLKLYVRNAAFDEVIVEPHINAVPFPLGQTVGLRMTSAFVPHEPFSPLLFGGVVTISIRIEDDRLVNRMSVEGILDLYGDGGLPNLHNLLLALDPSSGRRYMLPPWAFELRAQGLGLVDLDLGGYGAVTVVSAPTNLQLRRCAAAFPDRMKGGSVMLDAVATRPGTRVDIEAQEVRLSNMGGRFYIRARLLSLRDVENDASVSVDAERCTVRVAGFPPAIFPVRRGGNVLIFKEVVPVVPPNGGNAEVVVPDDYDGVAYYSEDANEALIRLNRPDKAIYALSGVPLLAEGFRAGGIIARISALDAERYADVADAMIQRIRDAARICPIELHIRQAAFAHEGAFDPACAANYADFVGRLEALRAQGVFPHGLSVLTLH